MFIQCKSVLKFHCDQLGKRTFFVVVLSFFGLTGCFGMSEINLKDSSASRGELLLEAPVLFSLAASNVSTDATPSFQVTGVKPGATLKIYGSRDCTVFLEDIFAASENVNLELQNPLSAGAYQFTARYEHDGVQSACSPPIDIFYYDPSFSLVKMKQTMKSVREIDGTVDIELEMTPPKAYDVKATVNFGGTTIPPNTAFAYASNEVTIPAGSTTGTLTVQLINDGVKRLDSMLGVNIESVNTSQVRIDTLPSTRVYIEDASATFKTVAKIQLSGNVSSTYSGCALMTDGEVKCWGEIGGALIGNQLPTIMDPGTAYSDISLGDARSCGLTILGTLKCWGAAPGNGSGTSISTPYAHAGSYSWFDTSSAYNTCGIRTSGDLYCWGYGSSFALNPVNIDPGVDYISVSMGINSYCGITSTQQVKCWGDNNYGQLGDSTTTNRLAPAGVIDGGQTYSKISAIGVTMCGITTGQKLKCWGRNNFGQVGDTTLIDKTVPTAVDPSTDYAEVYSGGSWSCGLTTSGLAKCWGENSDGQLGDGTAINKLIPTLVSGIDVFSKLLLQFNERFTCGVIAITNEVKCWGIGYGLLPTSLSAQFTFPLLANVRSAFGGLTNLGFITFNSESIFSGYPAPHIPQLQDPVKKFSSLSELCRIDENQKLYCKSYSGDGSTISHPNFVLVDGANKYVKVSTGLYANESAICAIRIDGKLFCWGLNSYYGQVGDGTMIDRFSLVEIDPGYTHIDVSVGGFSTCAIRTDGQLLCWGTNSEGTLGDNTIISKYSPVLIDVGTAYDQVNVEMHACGIVRTTGVLKCWGDGHRGKVGHNSQTDQLTPLIIDGGTSYKDVKTIDQHTCGITTAGALKCWGRNFNDEVGDGTGINRLVPTPIDIGTIYEKISGGHSQQTCAITNAGVTKCWGENSSGESGQLNYTVSTPQTVAGLPAMVEVYAGKYKSCGISTTGQLWCWGILTFSSENPVSGLIFRNLRIEGN